MAYHDFSYEKCHHLGYTNDFQFHVLRNVHSNFPTYNSLDGNQLVSFQQLATASGLALYLVMFFFIAEKILIVRYAFICPFHSFIRSFIHSFIHSVHTYIYMYIYIFYDVFIVLFFICFYLFTFFVDLGVFPNYRLINGAARGRGAWCGAMNGTRWRRPSTKPSWYLAGRPLETVQSQWVCCALRSFGPTKRWKNPAWTPRIVDFMGFIADLW